MRILFLTHAFNSLTQRLYVELTERGHEVSVEFDVHDNMTREAVHLFRPDLIIAPFLKRAIPEDVWRRYVCLVVHPGIIGDRGPSALDWAILRDKKRWGVTVLQANAEMDAGDIWATREFDMRIAPKNSLYRHEVTDAAVDAVLEAVEHFAAGGFQPEPLDYRRPEVRGRLQPSMAQVERRIDWAVDDTATVLRKLHASDSHPGVEDELIGARYRLFGGWPEGNLRGTPGRILAVRDGALCRATVDAAVWITHLRAVETDRRSLKLPAELVLGTALNGVPRADLGPEERARGHTWREIYYEERNAVGYLHFEFYNGAMSTEQCLRLERAFRYARSRPTRVIVLMGGSDFWSNGIHLGRIEAADSPADESWRNINAMDDLARSVITTGSHLTVAAMQGNAGAGGVFLALAADVVLAHAGVVLNPHYRNMGNLYGSEYWTYLLPRRVGAGAAHDIMKNRLPLGAASARRAGLVDLCLGNNAAALRTEVRAFAEDLARDPGFSRRLREKNRMRARDEARKPLERYRAEELEHLKLNFYGFDPSYHVARYNFIYKVPRSWTPLYLAAHRRRDPGTHTLQANSPPSVEHEMPV